jgi:hypothetical protein
MTPHPTPWIGLVALLAMFLLPFLPSWLFEGPRTIRHHPHRHVCAECGAPWADDHACALDGVPGTETLRAELRRLTTSTSLVHRPTQLSETND